MKRKFGTMINPSAVGNPLARAFERAIRTLILAQAKIRGMLSRLALEVVGDTVYRGDWLIMNQPTWFREPRGNS